MAKPERFRFRRLDHIGAADAADDTDFLAECFVNTGDVDFICDVQDPRRIVLGRTGSGKTAMLAYVTGQMERSITIQPESLALPHISNSNILRFFEDIGVKLDIFFRLLWRHIFTVELLKYHFNIFNEEAKRTFLQKLSTLFSNQKNKKALEYLEKWGKKFWEETEYRIKEVTTKLEADLQASAKASVPSLTSFSSEARRKLSESQTRDVLQRAQRVVNDVQIRQLSDILEMLDQAISDPQKKYFIIIDRLDENWIEDRLRYRLIRALVETVRDFRRVRNAKVVIALRIDLLERVFRLTRDSGFQEEKYESLFLQLSWSKEKLIEALDRRINHLIKSRYTTQTVTHRDILPKKIGKEPTIDYILTRTMMRPRDVILFLNECIRKSEGKPSIHVTTLRQAEGEYSRARLRSLSDEWSADYPNLIRFTEILKRKTVHFPLSSLTDRDCEEFCLDFVIAGHEKEDLLSTQANQVVEVVVPAVEFRRQVMRVFYRVGLVGLKLEPHEPFIWATMGRAGISRAEITDKTRVAVHPMFWRVLGIQQLKA